MFGWALLLVKLTVEPGLGTHTAEVIQFLQSLRQRSNKLDLFQLLCRGQTLNSNNPWVFCFVLIKVFYCVSFVSFYLLSPLA